MWLRLRQLMDKDMEELLDAVLCLVNEVTSGVDPSNEIYGRMYRRLGPWIELLMSNVTYVDLGLDNTKPSWHATLH
jgi:hypothetical protein